MLDPRALRENPEKIKENLEKRQDPKMLELVDEFVEIDKLWRDLDKKNNELRKQRNENAKSIRSLKGDEKDAAIKNMQIIKQDLDIVDKELRAVKDKRKWVLDRIPNMLHESVPYGVDDEENVEIRTWGEIRTFDFDIKDHHELMSDLNLVEIERARKTSGSRFYFLKNEAVLLELAILRYAIDVLQDFGVELFSTPSMVRKDMLYGTGFLPLGGEDIYKIEGEDLNLIGTSEVTLGGLHQGEVFLQKDLPIRYAGLSPCFRTEASASTKDDKGIFRVHEFKKVEMYSFTHPDKSWEEQERMIGIAEKIFQGLKIPYRVVNICTGDIGGVAARKYDIETWMPGQNRYREVGSCSNCTDYQARRLEIKYRVKDGAPPEGFVHTLNSTAITTTRPIIAILENYQNSDGSVTIPDVLVPYMGLDKIKNKLN